MAIIGAIETVRTQAPQTPAFAVAWKYVDDLLRPQSAVHGRVSQLQPGDSQKHELGAGVFAIEQAYETKPRTLGFFESHQRFIDLQVIVVGEEKMEVIDRSKMSVRKEYDVERDLVIYHDAAGASALWVSAGEATVFFPSDVHMPSLQAGANACRVWKSVLKVPVGA